MELREHAKGPKLVRMRRAVYPTTMTLREAKLQAGHTLGGFLEPVVGLVDSKLFRAARAEEDRIERSELVMRANDSPWWICGRFPEEDACSAPGCAYFAEVLCDYPMGRGKTCDLPLCPGHAHSIGTERDLCEIHFREFQRKAGADRINPWPPLKPKD